jgi:hypothetical protein
MEGIETFAHPVGGISRRRVLHVLAATAAMTQLVGLSDGVLHRASASTAQSQPPPAYDAIVGLL